MNRFVIILCTLLLFVFSSHAQLTIKNPSNDVLMKVINSNGGRVGIALGATNPASTLDIGGDLRIREVNTLAGETSASALVLDGNVVKKRTLSGSIWSGGWTFHESQEMVIECWDCDNSDVFFRWYDHAELGNIPTTAKAVYLHIAMSNSDPANYNLMVTELQWNLTGSPTLEDAISNGWFLTATVNNTRPAANAGIVKLNSNGLWIGLNNMDPADALDFCRVKVMGYFE